MWGLVFVWGEESDNVVDLYAIISLYECNVRVSSRYYGEHD